MKKAIYVGADGKSFEVDYDPEQPCWYCGYPVGEASMGGTVVCGACDMGKNRFTMAPWSWDEYKAAVSNFTGCIDGIKPKRIYESMFNESNAGVGKWTDQ